MIRKLALVVASATILGTVASPATARVIEPPTRKVDRVEVVYAEPVPSKRLPHRVYFELNDGSAYVNRHPMGCFKANEVPNRICRVAFFPGYAL